MKKILFLGASRNQLPPIAYAKSKGYQTIVCDYTPGTSAGDINYEVSTTDLETVLAIAMDLNIDGIVAYASDPAAPTAAYVAEKMGLPGNPYESVNILARKDLYRKFLKDNGFNTPRVLFESSSGHYGGWEGDYTFIIKPVDSSGSKGISMGNDKHDVGEALNLAISFSRSSEAIIEEFIKRDGYQIAGDGFIVDGKLAFTCFANEHFEKDGIVPIGESFPYIGEDIFTAEIQRALDLLGMKTGALNFDIMISDGKVYLMEIGPRNGGNLIPEVTKLHTGVDMIAATVEAAIGNKIEISSNPQGFYASYIPHSNETGVCTGIHIDERLDIIKQDIWVEIGDKVEKYIGSNKALGAMILRFKSQEEMLSTMDNMPVRIEVK